jgi:hypothetical protein
MVLSCICYHDEAHIFMIRLEMCQVELLSWPSLSYVKNSPKKIILRVVSTRYLPCHFFWVQYVYLTENSACSFLSAPQVTTVLVK